MSEKPPSIEQWKELYDAAVEFKKLAPWDWMFDSDLFGVKDPATGEVGYCCIMGSLGEHFALGLYQGAEGLDVYRRMQSGELGEEALFLQKCLMASFEDRDFIQKPDRDTIKRLGLKFRGRDAWPLFRGYRPGYAPWYLTTDEAEFLTLALQQAAGVATRHGDDPQALRPPAAGRYLVRVAEKGEGGLQWRDEWLAPDPLPTRAPLEVPLDEIRLARVRQNAVQREATWEIDCVCSPEGVQEDAGERPYYPQVMLFVDHFSAMILHVHLAHPEGYLAVLLDHFLGVMEKTRLVPGTILVRDPAIRQVFEPVIAKLGLRSRLVERLPQLDEALENLFQFMGGAR